MRKSPFPSEAEKSAVRTQWNLFQQGYPVDISIVGKRVHDSWLRSRKYGVSPYQRKKASVPAATLDTILHDNMEFINSATSIMGKLFKSIEALDGSITLADRNGVVLYTCYQNRHDIMPSHVVGDILSENVCGTNGIGTCLAEGGPVELVGAEHYSLEEHAWYCSSAPVFDSKSNIIGVFNISVPCEGRHYYQTSGLVEAVAYAISEQILLSELLSEQMAIMELLGEGVIVLNADGDIKSINKKACAILHLAASPVGQNFRRTIHAQDNIFTALSRQEPFQDWDVTLTCGIRSIPCLLSFSPIPGKGGILTLREGGRARTPSGQSVGTRAVFTFDRILGESEAIKNAVHMGRNAACSDIATLILGDSGTGKELFAQSIHNAGARRRGPFMAVNCGAIPRNLVQAELFGYDEGAFTGAARQGKPGKFELANGGTIFLDEIGEMPLDAQVSLLRLLQNGEVSRVGGKKSRYVDVRVIAATNRDLLEAVRQKLFRKDLYYRLSAFVLHVPSLRERDHDIRILADSFLKKFACALNKRLVGFRDDVYPLLDAYAWPGNVRELENCIERAVTMAEADVITPADLPEHLAGSPEDTRSDGGRLRLTEKDLIRRTLRENRGNMRRTATELGIARSTLYLKMRKFGLKKHEGGEGDFPG